MWTVNQCVYTTSSGCRVGGRGCRRGARAPACPSHARTCRTRARASARSDLTLQLYGYGSGNRKICSQRDAPPQGWWVLDLPSLCGLPALRQCTPQPMQRTTSCPVSSLPPPRSNVVRLPYTHGITARHAWQPCSRNEPRTTETKLAACCDIALTYLSLAVLNSPRHPSLQIEIGRAVTCGCERYCQ